LLLRWWWWLREKKKKKPNKVQSLRFRFLPLLFFFLVSTTLDESVTALYFFSLLVDTNAVSQQRISCPHYSFHWISLIPPDLRIEYDTCY